MNRDPGEWAVMYHGVQQPARLIKDSETESRTTVAKSIVQKSLKAGHRQAHKQDRVVITKSHEKAFLHYKEKSNANVNVGEGVYGSPIIRTCQSYYTKQFSVDDKGEEKYLLAFQCRVRPDKINIVSGVNDYWLIRDPQYIRPYGLLIAKLSTVERAEEIYDAYRSSYAKWIRKNKCIGSDNGEEGLSPGKSFCSLF